MEINMPKFRSIVFRVNKKVGSVFLGNYKSHFKGRGIEFEEARPYVEGDDTKHIHWAMSAKEDKLFMKQFSETKEITVYLMVDLSKSMHFSSKLQLMFEVAVILAISALKSSDKIGLIMFTNEGVVEIVPAKKGRKHVLKLLNDIRTNIVKETFIIKQPLMFLKKFIKHSTVVFLLSDMIDFQDYNLLHYLNIRNQIELCRVYNPEERGELQDKIYDFDTGRYKKYLHGRSIQSEFKKIITTYLEEQRQLLYAKKIRFCDVSTDKDPYPQLLTFFHHF